MPARPSSNGGASALLIVDHDEQYVRLMRRILASDHDCLFASAHRQGIDLLAEHRFDLMVCAVGRGGAGFIELLDEAARIAPRMPILVITGRDHCDAFTLAEESRDDGVFHHLAKPFTAEQLLGAVRGALDGT